MSASPRFGRRAAAAAALQAANEALNELPPTPDEMRQQKAEMQRAVQSEAWRRQDAESKADSLATQVQQLFGELQRKDREIAAVTRSKAEIEERWRVSEVERAKAALGPQGAAAAADDTDAVIRSLALAVDAGPKFEEELREFVFAKQDERRLVLVREKMRDLNPFSAPTGKTPKAVVLERVTIARPPHTAAECSPVASPPPRRGAARELCAHLVSPGGLVPWPPYRAGCRCVTASTARGVSCGKFSG
jgi:hypothetical protein